MMPSFEQHLFKKAEKMIRGKLKSFRGLETLIIDSSFEFALRTIEDLEENLYDIPIFSSRNQVRHLERIISEEIEQMEVVKRELLDDYEMIIIEHQTGISGHESLEELTNLIDESKLIVTKYYDNFVSTIERLTRNFKIISNILAIQDRLRDVKRSYHNSLNNLVNFQFIITVDNANEVLIDNFERLCNTLSERFQNPRNLIEKIERMSRNPCMEGQQWADCLPSSDSSSDEFEVVSSASEKSEKEIPECYRELPTEHTRIDSIENLKLNASQLEEQIATIQLEIDRVNETIDRKKTNILEAILKVIELEEMIEGIEDAMVEELHHFQTKVRALETQLMENFRGENSSEVKEHLEEQLMGVKVQHEEAARVDAKNYTELAKQARVFASSIGDVIEEYQKFHDESHEKYSYNMEKLNALLTRPVEFCQDSNGERFFFNKDNDKVYQVDVHRSQHLLSPDGERVKEALPLSTDSNGEFYIDRDRKVYTKCFFEDEFGRYYIDTHGFRHYQKDPRASEYALVNGNWVKTKDGTYEVDEKGLRIPDEPAGGEAEAENVAQSLADTGTYPGVKPTKISAEQFKYIKETLGSIFIKACAACYLHQPSNPILYVANFLRHHRCTEQMFKRREMELRSYKELQREMMEKEHGEE